jgi:PAS domain S-box-containing protein
MKGSSSKPDNKKASPAHPAPDQNSPLLVVAVGASAGGLEPLSSFLGAVPKNSGIAFVVVLHPSQGSKSNFPQLLAQRTALTVKAAQDNAPLIPNHVFVARQGTEVTISDGKLKVAAKARGGSAPGSIDGTMKSLAADRGRSAIGIVLSGTRGDGTEGLKAIKDAGGLTLVQDPAETQHDGMPRHAIAAAQPDHVLPAADMAEALMRYTAQDDVGRSKPFELDEPAAMPQWLEAVSREFIWDMTESGSFFDEAESIIQQNRALAAAVVTRQLSPIYFFGEIERYLHVPAGSPYADLPARIHTSSRQELRQTMLQALDMDRPAVAEIDILTVRDECIRVMVEAYRLHQKAGELVLISFIEPASDAARPGPARTGRNTGVLKAELADARRQLDRTLLELRDANKELRRKNEELQSLNDKFLSTNKELQGSKDQVISLNQEMTTAKGQLREALGQREQSAADLTNLLDSSLVATILLDQMLRIRLFNPTMRDLFALLDTDIGRPLANVLPKKFADPTLTEDVNAARSTGKPSIREIQGPGGVWYVRSVQPYRTKTAEIEGTIVTFADVTALKQAEVASTLAHHYVETIVNTVREPLVVIDADLRVEATNSAFCAAMNIPAERAHGRKLRDLSRPLLAQESLMELVSRALDGKTMTVDVEIEATNDVGEQRIWQAHAQSFHRAQSERPRILLALEDITEQRHIMRHQLQLLIDALPEPIVAVDDQRKIRFVSRHLEALFGYTPSELVGQKIDVLVPPRLREKHAALHKEFIEKPSIRGVGAGLEILGLRKDGVRIPLDIGLSPIMTVEGPLVVAALHDLRGLKEGEERLRAAKAAADRANQAKTRFLAAASHDLRQPLQTIGLLTGVLEKRAADPETRATLLRLDDAVAHMTGLVDTLLDINHIESGGIKVETAEIAVGPLVSRVADDYEPLALAKNLSLRVVRSTATISSDRRLLTRIIGNLVTNAVKYTDKGKILIGCRRRQGTLRIEIWDSGIGIPPGSIDAVFDEFYRVDRSDSSRFGLGLGLYIVKRFAELLGHKIEVCSIPGKGTVFAIVIANPSFSPTATGAEADAEHRWQPAALLVEDDQAQLDALRALLELEGYRVIAAQRGDEAMALLREERALHLSVIVADYRLPGKLNGLDVIRRVRANVGIATPAVLISGDRPAVALDTSEFADFLFIAKPVKAASLVSTVNSLISRAMPDWQPSKLATGAADQPQPPTTGRSRVAVIDDEPGVRDAARAVLQANGYDVAAFSSSEALLADPDHGRLSCIVVDISLPGLDGLELQRKLKAEGYGGIPIIFMTANSDLETAVEAMREGAADFLQKPVDGATISESVARALESNAAATLPPSADRTEVEARMATLTDRERQVLEQMVAGTLTKNIAAALGISQRTTEHHRQSVMRKMGVRSLAMLVRMVGGFPTVGSGASSGPGEAPPA